MSSTAPWLVCGALSDVGEESAANVGDVGENAEERDVQLYGVISTTEAGDAAKCTLELRDITDGEIGTEDVLADEVSAGELGSLGTNAEGESGAKAYPTGL